MDWKALFSSAGRTPRKTYWTIALLVGLFDATARFIAYALGDSPVVALLVPIIICALVIGVNNSIKRLHDFGRSGWWLLTPVGLYFVVGTLNALLKQRQAGIEYALLAVCYVGIVVMAIWIGATRGDPETNRFGPPPGVEPALQPTST